MTDEQHDPEPGKFVVACCRDGGRRIVMPGNILVCEHCDRAALMPRAAEAVEVPGGEILWPPP